VKHLASALACALALSAAVIMPAHATAQQDKMKTCNADAKAKGLKGDERKAFMKSCLSAKADAPAAGQTAQHQKMKTCNADAKAKGLKGDERKKFMSDCLKG
jgi:hypothetical protein